VATVVLVDPEVVEVSAGSACAQPATRTARTTTATEMRKGLTPSSMAYAMRESEGLSERSARTRSSSVRAMDWSLAKQKETSGRSSRARSLNFLVELCNRSGVN